MPSKRVLSVGQCAADHAAISRTLEGLFQAEVESVDRTPEALDRLRRETFDLVLVNRVLDADGSAGLELIREVKADEALRKVPIMLVSNYEDAQREAAAAGAAPGFGKAALGQPATTARLKTFLGESARSGSHFADKKL